MALCPHWTYVVSCEYMFVGKASSVGDQLEMNKKQNSDVKLATAAGDSSLQVPLWGSGRFGGEETGLGT